MRRLVNDPRVRALGALLVAVGLAAAVVLQRQTIFDALNEIRNLPARITVVLGVLAVVERVSRAAVIWWLLPDLSLGRSEMMSDIGAAASKGIPAGGPIATVLRWQVARQRAVDAPRFIVMLIASGVATAFVSWGYPLVATLSDMVGRDASWADLGIVAVCVGVLGSAALFWTVALRSERAHRFASERSTWILSRWPGVQNPESTSARADEQDVVAAGGVARTDAADRGVQLVDEIRDGLRTIARRPGGLFSRTLIAQGTGALILWVALDGLGVGDELGATEFARVFFVAHILGSLAPTPGGVGVIEVGVTGALVAAGVATDVALAGVLIYRFITYVLPIIVGTVWYLVWRSRPSSEHLAGSQRPAGPVHSGRDVVH